MIRFAQTLKALVAALALLLSVVAPAAAHEIRPAIVDMTVDDDAWQAEIQLNLEARLAGIGPEHEDTNESPNAAEYEKLRLLPPLLISQIFNNAEAALLAGLNIRADGERLTPTTLGVMVPGVGDVALARTSVWVIGGALPDGAKTLTWAWDPAFGNAAVRVRDGKTGDVMHASYIRAGQTGDPVSLDGATEQSLTDNIVNYLVVGFTHILPLGLDHILFVVGLFLLSAKLGPLLWQVSSFTIAHTATLALGMLGWVNLPPSIVEPLIAASIIYVGVENIITNKLHRWRPAVVFAFGLLHGLGFAGVLTEIGVQPDTFLASLIAFNVGVELGQLAVIAICFAAVGLWFRNKPWYRQRITIPASVAVSLMGAWWLVERTVL